ncbi:MAG: hypothetical protein ACTHMI_05860 [Mucilaginibacter sp.]
MKLYTILLLIALAAVSCKKDQTIIFPGKQSSLSGPDQPFKHLPDGRHPEKHIELHPHSALKFKNVVILGNSITFTPSNPNGEWKGNWGMAASAADSDYVHRLTAHFTALNPTCRVSARNIAEFEIDYVNYDFDANLKDLRDSAPDLLILRIGEDVDVPTYNANIFKARYTALIDYFISKNSKLLVLGAGPLWNAYLMEPIMHDNAYVSLAHINEDRTNTAYGLFNTPGLQVHPSDKGMRAISDSIWSGVKRLPAPR